MAAISNDWLEYLKPEFSKPYYAGLYRTVRNEYKEHLVFPPSDEIFSAFELTPISKVKVVILGQDPYHNVGQAHGLSFSVKPGVKLPPSLVNIYKELNDDLGIPVSNSGYLINWAKQGVLLLNTVLTVRAHEAFSHHDIVCFPTKLRKIIAFAKFFREKAKKCFIQSQLNTKRCYIPIILYTKRIRYKNRGGGNNF